MAFRDTWHRALTYFGLAQDERYADDEYGDDFELEAELEERYRTREQVRRVAPRRRDEIDEIFADDPASRRGADRVLRSVGNGRAEAGVRVHLRGSEELQRRTADRRQVQGLDPGDPQPPGRRHRPLQAADRFRERPHLRARRRHAAHRDKVFLLTPRNVEVSAEERARLLEKGFFNQS